jgi:hypothetical protein
MLKNFIKSFNFTLTSIGVAAQIRRYAAFLIVVWKSDF